MKNKQTKEYTREYLIDICEKAIVPVNKWGDRDTPRSMANVGITYVYLKAGCEFRILTKEIGRREPITDDSTICLEIKSPTFRSIEYGNREGEWDHYYLPTNKRLQEAKGNDWY